MRVSLAVLGLWFLSSSPLFAAESVPAREPDSVAVQRFEKAWKYPQAGWLVLHIEGSPYERGVQHGRLMAREIVDYIKALARTRSHKDPESAWKSLRLLTDTAFLRKYDVECLEEMKGIADGAAAAGAKYDGRRLDLLDIVTLNSDVEVGFLELALQATPTGLDSKKFGRQQASPPLVNRREMCSAFVATTPATDKSTGGVMLGHITMSSLSWVYHINVWLDVTPTNGHRFVCQTFPGGIQSGMDYYISASGLLIAETTIDQSSFDPTGETEASRIRRAVQYANNIDDAVAILGTKNNGLYTNEWLIADTKTNEIAMYELGTRHTKLYRSSRDEWPAGTKGFYWGCNNTKDRDVLSDTVADPRGKPGNLVLHPGRRDVAWLKLFDKHQQRGGLSEAFGFEAYSTAPIVGYPSCDAKFTTSALAKDLSSWAIFGPPLGKAWRASKDELETDPEVQPLVANDWTLLRTHDRRMGTLARPESDKSAQLRDAPVDLDPFPDEEHETKLKFEQRHPFAWRGTLRPKTSADKGLVAAFAEFEKVVAFENALLADAKEGKLDRHAQGLVDSAWYTHISNWWAARQRLGHDVPLAKTQPDPRSLDWYPIALGQGVFLLWQLRRDLGGETFDRLMDEFGMAHANEEVSMAQFQEFFAKSGGEKARDLLAQWFGSEYNPASEIEDWWSIHSFESEPERALIVYGGGGFAKNEKQRAGLKKRSGPLIDDELLRKPTEPATTANREIAERLQYAIARRFGNHHIPIKADADVTSEDLKSHHLLIVGEPATNSLLRLGAEKLEVHFGTQSFSVRGEKYAHPDSAVIAAGPNFWNDRYSVVVFVGLSARATHRIVDTLSPEEETSPRIVVYPAHRAVQRFVFR